MVNFAMRISLLFCRIGGKGVGSFNSMKILPKLPKLPKKTLGFYLGIMPKTHFEG